MEMEQIIAVQRMQDYIEQNIDSRITPADLSKAALFSPWYSYRLFQKHVGISPSSYIRRLRLAKAALRLKNDKTKIIDTAFEFGFENVDSFTRAFYREFGMNPSEYAKNPVPIMLFVPYGAKYREMKKENIKMERVKTIFIQKIKKMRRKVIVKRGIKATEYFEYCNEVGCDVWGMLLSMDSLCGEPISMWLPDKYVKPNTSSYVQGVEVSRDFCGVIPNGFDVIELPEAEYLMFQGEPFAEENYSEAIALVQKSMDKYDPIVIGCVWDNENPRIQLEPKGDRGYIELRAIKTK